MADCVVSLTSYGRRLQTVHLTIESIGAGTERPARLILWVDEGELRRISHMLSAQRRRGLEIIETRGTWGPHKKYYPYCMQSADDGRLLVTADDDVLYPRAWLQDLVNSARSNLEAVWCHRARRVRVDSNENLLPYEAWPLADDVLPRFDNLATGVGGVAYPPALQVLLRDAGTAFMEHHARTDDLWLFRQEAEAEFAVGQVRSRARSPIELPATQHTALAVSNQTGGQNDIAIRRGGLDDVIRRRRGQQAQADECDDVSRPGASGASDP